jgi:hypothetical protein
MVKNRILIQGRVAFLRRCPVSAVLSDENRNSGRLYHVLARIQAQQDSASSNRERLQVFLTSLLTHFNTAWSKTVFYLNKENVRGFEH